MTTKITVYNDALLLLGERKTTLTEQREPRRVLDDLWDTVVAYCLERKFWNFSYRSVAIDASTSVVPEFGFLYAFPVPDDRIRTRLISSTPTFDPPLLQFREEAGYWFTNVTPLYVQFNSRDTLYGLNIGAWPASFADYVAHRLATKACARLPAKAELLAGPQGLIKREEKAYKVAAANCAMNEAVGFAPQSSWVRSRRGFSSRLPGPGGDNPTGGSLIP